ncbi:uncharacterized protein METZ01_LOCUS70541 [marine metagenome]|jgi:hypothetical protein|uniref:Uncharacterized protein n=1 Tax=marine metagenome TaxID=408172 RepID=A0A381TS09_9ZZZZ
MGNNFLQIMLENVPVTIPLVLKIIVITN